MKKFGKPHGGVEIGGLTFFDDEHLMFTSRSGILEV